MKQRFFIPLVLLLTLLFAACSSSSSSSSDEDSDSSSSIIELSSSENELSSSSTESAASSSSLALSSSSSSEENSNSSSSMIENTFIDIRDGQIYEYVKIGSQDWMAENLNYDTLDGTASWCYNNSADNCAKYGRLYNWAAVMDFNDSCLTKSCLDQIQSPHQGICPDGWHVPSNDEWDELVDFVGGSSIAGTKLKSSSDWNPVDGIPGTDDYDFSALPGGLYLSSNTAFYAVGTDGDWWSASENGASEAFRRYMLYNDMRVSSGDVNSYSKRNGGFSLRCVKDS